MILFPEFYDRYGPWAVIAGASEGIGQSYAHLLAERGLNLVTIARRAQPLETDAALLRRRHRVEVRPFALDLAADDLAEKFDAATADLDIGLLICNACYSRVEPFLDISLEDHHRMLDVNCRAPLTLAQRVAPRLAQRGKGGIILMSSMAGFQGAARISTYAATKAFDTSLAQSLWISLRPKGVDVLAVVAGATLTPAFQATTPEAKQAKALPMLPAAVAREGLAALGRGPVHITGRINRLVYAITALMTRAQRTRFFSGATDGIYAAGDPR